MNEPPKDAIRFPNPPRFTNYDDTPTEYAVEIRDDVPGGCIVWVLYRGTWTANEGSPRALVRMLLDRSSQPQLTEQDRRDLLAAAEALRTEANHADAASRLSECLRLRDTANRLERKATA